MSVEILFPLNICWRFGVLNILDKWNETGIENVTPVQKHKTHYLPNVLLCSWKCILILFLLGKNFVTTGFVTVINKA